MLCDLHVHSTYSDGTYSPAQLIDEAERIGLAAIALCDHNTVSGLPEFMESARGRGVEAVPGIEFSTDYRGTELHILALFVKTEHYGAITALLEDWKQRKEQSNIDLVAALNRAGYDLSYEAIKAKGNGYINRAHIAAALTEKGYTASIQDAFKKLLNPSKGYYTPPRKLDAFDIIRFIVSIGAVPVLAHPFLNLNERELRQFLPAAKQCGLAGMEVLYPKFSPEETAMAAALTEEFGLLKSGGSDFHGANKPDISLGTGRGELEVPWEYLQLLREKVT